MTASELLLSPFPPEPRIDPWVAEVYETMLREGATMRRSLDQSSDADSVEAAS